MPDVDRLNLQVRLRAVRLTGQELDLFADVINVLDWHRAPTEIPDSFATSTAGGDRRWARLGLEYHY